MRDIYYDIIYNIDKHCMQIDRGSRPTLPWSRETVGRLWGDCGETGP